MSGILLNAAAISPSSITVSSNWDSPSGATPQTTATRTLTVPSLNPGVLIFTVVTTGTTTYSKNAGAFTALTDTMTLTIASGDTLALRLAGATKTASISVFDNSTSTLIGSTTIATT